MWLAFNKYLRTQGITDKRKIGMRNEISSKLSNHLEWAIRYALKNP